MIMSQTEAHAGFSVWVLWRCLLLNALLTFLNTYKRISLMSVLEIVVLLSQPIYFYLRSPVIDHVSYCWVENFVDFLDGRGDIYFTSDTGFLFPCLILSLLTFWLAASPKFFFFLRIKLGSKWMLTILIISDTRYFNLQRNVIILSGILLASAVKFLTFYWCD